MAQTLPHELLVAIVDHIVGGPPSEISPTATADLRALSLTSRAFGQRCREQIFHTVDLYRASASTSDYERYLTRLAEILDSTSTELCAPGSLAKQLNFVFDEAIETHRGSILNENAVRILNHSLPAILPHFKTLESLRFISRLRPVYRKQTWSFQDVTGKALIDCLRQNPIANVTIHGFSLPCRFRTSLPSTIRTIDLRAYPRCYTAQQNTNSQRDSQWSCGECDFVTLDDADASRSCYLPTLTSLTIGGFSDLSGEVALHMPSFFSHLTHLTWAIMGDIETRADLSVILLHTANSLRELGLIYITLNEGISSDDLYIAPPPDMPHLKKLSIDLTLLENIDHGIGSLPFSPHITSVILNHLQYPSFSKISSLSVSAVTPIFKDEGIALIPRELMPFLPFHSRVALQRLDTALADRSKFPNLNKIRIAIDAVSVPYPQGWNRFGGIGVNEWGMEQVFLARGVPVELEPGSEDAKYEWCWAELGDRLKTEVEAALCLTREAVQELMIDIEMTVVRAIREDWWD